MSITAPIRQLATDAVVAMAVIAACGPNVQRGNPFWVVRVAPNVLHQHNGFFNPYFLVFARDLVLGRD